MLGASGMDRFKADIEANEDLREKFTEACKRVAAEGASDDAEVIRKAAAELGYEFSIAEAERTHAGLEQIDDDALDEVAGGSSCWMNYECFALNHTPEYEDTKGHELVCIVAWHCYTAAIHTEGGSEQEACWENYECVFSHNNPVF